MKQCLCLIAAILLLFVSTNKLNAQPRQERGKTAVFISLSNYSPDFGYKQNFTSNLNNQLTMQDVSYTTTPGHSWRAGLQRSIGRKTFIQLGVHYSQTTQWINYVNLLNDLDRQQFAFGGFTTITMSYNHRRLGATSALGYQFWKGFYVEAGMSPTWNTSKDDFFSLGNAGVDSIYRPALYKNSEQYPTHSLFAHINVGYNWKGIFAAFYYEEHLNSFKRSFAFRGNSYTIKQPHWINKGFTIGYAYTFKKRQQKEKSNL